MSSTPKMASEIETMMTSSDESNLEKFGVNTIEGVKHAHPVNDSTERPARPPHGEESEADQAACGSLALSCGSTGSTTGTIEYEDTNKSRRAIDFGEQPDFDLRSHLTLEMWVHPKRLPKVREIGQRDWYW